MKQHLGEILTALVLCIIRYFEKKKILKAKNEEKFKAIDSNTKYYRSIIDELNKTKKN